jgi:hypothetical protein
LENAHCFVWLTADQRHLTQRYSIARISRSRCLEAAGKRKVLANCSALSALSALLCSALLCLALVFSLPAISLLAGSSTTLACHLPTSKLPPPSTSISISELPALDEFSAVRQRPAAAGCQRQLAQRGRTSGTRASFPSTSPPAGGLAESRRKHTFPTTSLSQLVWESNAP